MELVVGQLKVDCFIAGVVKLKSMGWPNEEIYAEKLNALAVIQSRAEKINIR